MTHTVQAVAWTLIHFCWQAAAIAFVYRVAELALARRSSNARYLAGLAALLLMLASALATCAWETRSAPSMRTQFAALPGAVDAHHEFEISPDLIPAGTNEKAAPAGPSLDALLPWIDAFWLVGVVLLSLRSIGGWWMIRRLRTWGTADAPQAAAACFARIAHALGLRRPVLLRVSSAVAGPVTLGVLRAMVLLPLAAATRLSAEELEVVLAHELAHVRRADFFWNLMQTLVETLFFYHPAVWWIGSRIRHERELCCDDLALTVCPDALVYARALYRLEEQRSNQLRLAMALDGHQPPHKLRMRIARLLGEPITHTANRAPISLAGAGVLLFVLLLAVPQVLAGLKPSRLPVSSRPVMQAAAQSSAAQAPVAASVAVRHAAAPVVRAVAQAAGQTAAGQETQQSTAESSEQTAPPAPGRHGDYIDEMKAAGYDVDLDKYIAMKVQDITPEYARQMSQLGFGKLSADDLIACKVQGVSPETIAKMKQDGFEIKSVHDAIQYRIFDITPEYLSKLKSMGIDVSNPHEAIQYRIFNVTPEFIAGMKAAGFDNLTQKQILALRTQDVSPEYARSIRQQFPQASIDDIVKTKIFNINAEFIASAKRHGFGDLTLEKLVKLRISGILDDESDSK
jgi:beta-lactamase regulating signal transducer with metallopeptidase domain